MNKIIAILLCFFIVVSFTPSFAQIQSSGFTNPVNISNNVGDSMSPQTIFSEDGIYVTWIDHVFGTYDVFFSKSIDGGNTFEKKLNLGTVQSGQSSLPSMAKQDKNVYVVWQGISSQMPTIYFTKSVDDGNEFENPLLLSDPSKNSAFPQIETSANHVYVAWIEKSQDNSTNIGFSHSDNFGDNFTKPTYLTSAKENTGIPKISTDGSDVYLIWEDNSKGGYEILLDKSADSGVSFGKPVNISNNTGSSGAPQLYVQQNKIYVVWMDDSEGVYDIFFTKSDDGGITFGKPVNLSHTKQDSGYPQFAISGNDVYVVWTETVSGENYDILFAKSTDDGKSFGTPINLSNNSGGSGWPQIISSSGNIYVSWVDDTAGDYDIMITKSSDDGNSFEKPVNISQTQNESYANTMGVTSNSVGMVWQEGVQGKHNILYSKSTALVPEFGSLATVILVLSIVSVVAISLKTNLRSHL